MRTGTELAGAECVDIDGCEGDPCFEGASCVDIVAPGTGFTWGICPPGSSADSANCTGHDDFGAFNTETG